MKIANTSFILPKSNYKIDKQNNSSIQLNPLNKDVFQKSVSFCGSNINGNDPCELPEDSKASGLFSNIWSSIFGTLEQQLDEIVISTFINAFSNPKGQQLLSLVKARIISLDQIYQELFSKEDCEFVKGTLKNAGIDNLDKLRQFLNIYSSNQETKNTFGAQGIEALDIYSKLERKQDLKNFPELLLYLHNSSDNKEEFNPNPTMKFFETIAVKNMQDFKDKFSHLKEYFNGFENISDMVEAIDYIKCTYDDKINFINKALSSSTKLKTTSANDIYKSNIQLIDFLYEENNSSSLTPLNSFIDSLISLPKLNKHTLNTFAPYFNNYEKQEDNLRFLKFISSNKIAPDDLNTVSKKSIVSDIDRLECLLNKDVLINKIEKTGALGKKNSASQIYKKCFDLYNSIYDNGKSDDDEIKLLTSIIVGFNFKDNSDMLRLYNRINSAKEKSLTKEQLKDFVNLLSFCEPSTLDKDARVKKLSPLDYLKSEKQKFDDVKDEIKTFIESDSTNFFLGESAFSIYKKYKNSINENPNQIGKILENIKTLNATNAENYSAKMEKIQKLQSFFPDKKSLFSFIEKNNVKFDSKGDEDFINNCCKMLSLISDDEKEYYISSDFFFQSKNQLSKFEELYPDENEQKEILSTVSKKKVPSLNSFNDFIKEYEDINSKRDNVIFALQNAPCDIDFSEFTKILSKLKQGLQNLNISSIKINNANIASINIESLAKTKSIKKENVAEILNNILCADEGENFILKLPSAVSYNPQEYSAFKISNELAKKIDEGNNSYKNLVNKLKISRNDLQIKSNSSDYIYTSAIKETLPKEFINFVNDEEWTKINDKIPSISLHAKLRIIERFGLSDDKPIEYLYTDESKKHLNEIIKTIYCNQPISTVGTEQDNRIVMETPFKDDIVKSVFSKYGVLISVMPKGVF